MTYRAELTKAMNALAADPRTIFVGYGLRSGRALGTLNSVPDSQILETPVAENLMAGLAIGMALEGLRPVVFFERFDFVCNALDAIVNHLDKIAAESDGEFSPGAILRIVVGNRRKPLFTGSTHTQNHTAALRSMVSFPVFELVQPDEIADAYAVASERQRAGRPTALIEYKDLV